MQEAINNAVRHAQADHITVTLTGRADGISIEVRDDGIGIDRPGRRRGAGIDNMQTRAQLISAGFSVGDGRQARGSVVSIHLPIAEQPSPRDGKSRLHA